MTTFGEKLRAKKKNIKSTSVDTYLRNIRRLRKVKHALPIPESDHKWLLDKALLAWFDKQTLNIRRHLGTAAQVSLDVYGKKSAEWKKRSTGAMQEFDADRRKRVLTSKQKSKVDRIVV